MKNALIGVRTDAVPLPRQREMVMLFAPPALRCASNETRHVQRQNVYLYKKRDSEINRNLALFCGFYLISGAM